MGNFSQHTWRFPATQHHIGHCRRTPDRSTSNWRQWWYKITADKGFNLWRRAVTGNRCQFTQNNDQIARHCPVDCVYFSLVKIDADVMLNVAADCSRSPVQPMNTSRRIPANSHPSNQALKTDRPVARHIPGHWLVKHGLHNVKLQSVRTFRHRLLKVDEFKSIYRFIHAQNHERRPGFEKPIL